VWPDFSRNWQPRSTAKARWRNGHPFIKMMVLPIFTQTLKIYKHKKFEWVTILSPNQRCRVLIVCGTPTPTRGLQNLGLRTPTPTPGQKPDSNSDSRTHCVKYWLCKDDLRVILNSSNERCTIVYKHSSTRLNVQSRSSTCPELDSMSKPHLKWLLGQTD